MNRKYIILFCIFCSCNQMDKKKITPNHSDLRILRLKDSADLYYHTHKFLLAIKYLDMLINIDSTNGEYYFRRGYCYDKFGDTSENKIAIENYLNAIKWKYHLASSYYNLGLCYVGIEDSIALKYFEESLQRDPNYINSIIQIQACNERMNHIKRK
jgi:tetratricopeptide (TPR) repeat protein